MRIAHRNSQGSHASRRWAFGLVIAALLSWSSPARAGSEPVPSAGTSPLPDLSGLAWIEGDLFVAVHDTKHFKGNDQPRVSVLKLPSKLDGLLLERPLLAWPEQQGASNDFESIAGIPGTRQFLLVESGDEGSVHRRIFLTSYSRQGFQRQGLQLDGTMTWPVPVTNVEGTAVARVGERLLFIYAERSHGQRSTQIKWADLELQPMKLGRFQEVTFNSPGPSGPDIRAVTALEVDRQGRLFAASALDSGNNNGPFRSMVWRIGRVRTTIQGKPYLALDPKPELVATLDGLKVESLAMRELPGRNPELFVGVDDENFGGTMRPIPLLP